LTPTYVVYTLVPFVILTDRRSVNSHAIFFLLVLHDLKTCTPPPLFVTCVFYWLLVKSFTRWLVFDHTSKSSFTVSVRCFQLLCHFKTHIKNSLVYWLIVKIFTLAFRQKTNQKFLFQFHKICQTTTTNIGTRVEWFSPFETYDKFMQSLRSDKGRHCMNVSENSSLCRVPPASADTHIIVNSSFTSTLHLWFINV
jgi:hypothetical protein